MREWKRWAELLLLLLGCTSGKPFRTPEQGFPWYPDGFSAPIPWPTPPPNAHTYTPPPPLSLLCLLTFLHPHLLICTLTSLTQWCPQAWLLTDAGWECRAQLGLIAAVYLIKTWEDPTGVRAREDTGSIYRVVHRCTHTHLHIPGKQGVQVLRFVFGDHSLPPLWMGVCLGV